MIDRFFYDVSVVNRDKCFQYFHLLSGSWHSTREVAGIYGLIKIRKHSCEEV
jgi:hypothetical protein